MNRRLSGVMATAILLSLMLAPSAQAVTTWTAPLGSYGVATLRIGSPDRLAISIRKFRGSTSYLVTLRRGDCRSLGRLALAARVTTNLSGSVSRTFSLTSAQKSLATLPLVIRFGTRCAPFAAAIAIAPAPTPTATATPTPSSTPIPTPTATPIPTPTATPTPDPPYVY